MKKRRLFVIPLLLLIIMVTGCFKRDSLEDIEIVTTAYPYEYITNVLYGEHSLVTSIYPDGTDIDTYKLSNKIIKDYSKKELFIYNGLNNDKDLARKLLDYNKNMLIIDATSGMEITYGNEELWLNPSNLLMIVQNIKNGLNEYITNSYLKKEIETNYEQLKVSLSELDADIKLTAENASRKTIVVNNNSLKYLEKYGFNVISLDDSNINISDKTITEVNKLIDKGEVTHLFVLDKTKNSKVFDNIVSETGISTYTFKKLDNINDIERDNKENYITLMNYNIELLRSELY